MNTRAAIYRDLSYLYRQPRSKHRNKAVHFSIQLNIFYYTRYGYKRARWHRLWRVQIQEYFTATIQNIMVLISNIKEQAPASAIARAKNRYKRVGLSLQQRFYYFKQIVTHIITFLPINLCETND